MLFMCLCCCLGSANILANQVWILFVFTLRVVNFIIYFAEGKQML